MRVIGIGPQDLHIVTILQHTGLEDQTTQLYIGQTYKTVTNQGKALSLLRKYVAVPVCCVPHAQWIYMPMYTGDRAINPRSPNIAVTRSDKDNAVTNAKKAPTPPEKPVALHDHISSPTSTSHLAPSLSTALLWILATAMSLFSAPLVEPRYFILPWVFWRLLLPAWSAPGGQRYDFRLWVESAWFVLVNIVTMYIFVTRPFFWYTPDGVVADEGRIQRFMW